MNLLAHWKLFTAFLIVGLVASLGLRAATSGTPAEESTAGPEPQPHAHETPDAKGGGLLVDLGNRNCPIMDGPVDGETYAEWNHLRVAYCCPGCDRKFRRNPEEVLDAAGIEWREAARAVQEYLDATGEEKERKLASIRERWSVVREPDGE